MVPHFSPVLYLQWHCIWSQTDDMRSLRIDYRMEINCMCNNDASIRETAQVGVFLVILGHLSLIARVLLWYKLGLPYKHLEGGMFLCTSPTHLNKFLQLMNLYSFTSLRLWTSLLANGRPFTLLICSTAFVYSYLNRVRKGSVLCEIPLVSKDGDRTWSALFEMILSLYLIITIFGGMHSLADTLLLEWELPKECVFYLQEVWRHPREVHHWIRRQVRSSVLSGACYLFFS